MSDTKPNGLGIGTRTSSLRKTSINSAGDAPRTGKAATVKRGTKRSADGGTPVVDEEGVKQSLGVALDSDDEGDRDGECLGKRDQRRLLRVLTAMSVPPAINDATEDPHNVKKKAKFLQLILDQAFTEDSKDPVTLRTMLASPEPLKAQSLIEHINLLATALAPAAPLPFPPTAAAQRAHPPLNPRLPGSRAKPIKDALLHDTFSALADVVRAVLAPQATGEEDVIGPRPRVRWALHQRLGGVPAKGGKAPAGTVDWFSGVAESIDVEEGEGTEGDVDMDGKGDGVLTRMKREKAFANANVVVVPPPIANDKNPHSKPPTLDEVLFVHPTRAGGKSAWKERRKVKRTTDRRIVTYPRYYSSFTPSFAPTHDSSAATNGFGYYQTWEAGMGKAAVHSWMTSGWNGAEFTPPDEEETSHELDEFRPRASKDEIEDLLKSVVEEPEMEIDPALVEAVDESQREMRALQKRLDQNAVWVRQLQLFQELRVRRGQREPLEEEERIAQRLQQSLVELASETTPAALLPKALRETEEPIAVLLAKKVIHTSAPSVRGTLDPTRPRALSDNTTALARAPDQIAPPIARPTPGAAPRPAPNMRPTQQWTGSHKASGPSQAAGYNTPQALQMRGSRYAFPPQSTPGMQGRSSPIPPINSIPSVLRNSLPQPVGLGSFSPVGRSTLAPGSGTYAPPPSGQGGRGIGSAMGMSMANSGMNGSPVPAFRPSNSMRG